MMNSLGKKLGLCDTQFNIRGNYNAITASIRRGMEAISLWHCSGVMEAQVALIAAFGSSALLGLVSFILTYRFSMAGVGK